MKATHLNINLPLNFNHDVDLESQLPYKEILELTEVLKMRPENMKPGRLFTAEIE